MKLFFTCLLFAIHALVYGQNRINYSQYMHNHQAFNPAYFELATDFGGSVLYRNQWTAIEGAPSNFIGNVFGSVGNSNFGAQVIYDRITIYEHIEAGLSYSYAIRLGDATHMSLGMKASMNQETNDYTLLNNLAPGDSHLSGKIKRNSFNMGTGIFVRNPDWHAGVGAPYLFNNGMIDQNTNLYNDISYQHFFLTGGYKVIKTSNVEFYPTTMMKWSKGSPFNMSLDMNFMFNDLFWTSLGYRTDKSMILSAGLVLWEKMKIIYSFDLGLGSLNRYGGFTHEFSLGYGMEMYRNSFNRKKFVNRKGGRMRVKKRRWK